MHIPDKTDGVKQRKVNESHFNCILKLYQTDLKAE